MNTWVMVEKGNKFLLPYVDGASGTFPGLGLGEDKWGIHLRCKV